MTTTMLTVTCLACGHERVIDRNELITGAWLRQPCPVCGKTRKAAS